MKIIIVGCGNVGATLAEQLSKEKHDITVIDTRQQAVEAVTNVCDVMGIIGNGASFNAQTDAGIADADLMIVHDYQSTACSSTRNGETAEIPFRAQSGFICQEPGGISQLPD